MSQYDEYLLHAKIDLSFIKRDPSHVKRYLVTLAYLPPSSSDHNILHIKTRPLIHVKRDLSCIKRDISYIKRDQH
jgi:hypothetical protein